MPIYQLFSVFGALTNTSWLWSLSQTSGVLDVVLLGLLVISGIGQITSLAYRLLEPLPAWVLHRALATALGACILIHATTLMLNTGSVSLAAVALLPFTPHAVPAGLGSLSETLSLVAAIGMLVAYAAAVSVLVAVFWHNTKPSIWRIAHYLLCVALLTLFLYSLYSSIPLLVWICGMGVVIMSVFGRSNRGRPATGGL
ncbi:MAG TPA: hypothetical protein VGM08_03025 [Candidatus Saccharimonadales bacterium]|jgi:predicted ferric reductase